MPPPQRMPDTFALKEKIKLFDEWLTDLAIAYRRMESMPIVSTAKAATLKVLSEHIRKVKSAQAAAMRELIQKEHGLAIRWAL